MDGRTDCLFVKGGGADDSCRLEVGNANIFLT